MNHQHHLPVLLNEVIEGLNIVPNGFYIDATFGRGGHSQAILERLNDEGRLLVMDKDPQAIATANQKWANDPRVSIQHASFATLASVAKSLNKLESANGILCDLGVSSPQLDDPLRGFSFLRDGPLDMRMDTTQKIDAATWIANVEESELIKVLFEFGEEKFARRITRAIISARQVNPITTTKQLADIIAAAVPKWEKHKHPATRSFQAIRIAVNDELGDLQAILAQSLDVLCKGGRLCVISFHSLEDRLVKRFIQEYSTVDSKWAKLPIKEGQMTFRLKKIAGLIRPSNEEINTNPRARSARLRIAEKVA